MSSFPDRPLLWTVLLQTTRRLMETCCRSLIGEPEKGGVRVLGGWRGRWKREQGWKWRMNALSNVYNAAVETNLFILFLSCTEFEQKLFCWYSWFWVLRIKTAKVHLIRYCVKDVAIYREAGLIFTSFKIIQIWFNIQKWIFTCISQELREWMKTLKSLIAQSWSTLLIVIRSILNHRYSVSLHPQ